MILGGAPMHSLTVIINNAEQFTAYHLLTLISLKISFQQQYEKLVRREVFFFTNLVNCTDSLFFIKVLNNLKLKQGKRE